MPLFRAPAAAEEGTKEEEYESFSLKDSSFTSCRTVGRVLQTSQSLPRAQVEDIPHSAVSTGWHGACAAERQAP